MRFKVNWTKIDEAPLLASYCLLPILKSYARGTGIEFLEKDISLAGRIIANFPDNLTEKQKIPDYLNELGELTQDTNANIIKLPNISASIPQLKAAIKELQNKDYKIPDYPEEPETDEEKKLKERFAKVLGSAVNPVLREGNSDRRAAASVKKFAQKYPHKMIKPWPGSGFKCRVAHMKQKYFYVS
ncbi:MAG TPA: NADP-dependent isocitrate dehydrogenase, partial [Ignavibacteriaceae bacterium]|nr:NADP-dependent isocitrate dehydrogenase [Ignavibacteriaceae bacterium]